MNRAVSNQLTDVGESVLGMTVNLLMCDRGRAMYSVLATVFLCLYINLPVTPKMRSINTK
jgi:hypothetical protein